MKINLKKKASLGLALALLFCSSQLSNASVVRLSDGSLSVSILGTTYTNTTQDIAARWGTWNSGTSTFTEITGGAGYYSADLEELKVDLDRSSQVVSIGTLLAIAVYQAAPQTSFSSSYNHAILTDSTWGAPTFDLSPTVNLRDFTSSTTAVVGSFNFNGGVEQINLVPEPSTGALMMIGAAGLVALRRLRKV